MKLTLNAYDKDVIMPLARELGVSPIQALRHIIKTFNETDSTKENIKCNTKTCND